jgi:hypothetical protein
VTCWVTAAVTQTASSRPLTGRMVRARFISGLTSAGSRRTRCSVPTGGLSVGRCGRTRAEVAAKLAEMVAGTNPGIPLATSAWTVQAYSDHWLAEVVAPRLRPATLASYRDTIRLHVAQRWAGSRCVGCRPTSDGSWRRSRLVCRGVQ